MLKVYFDYSYYVKELFCIKAYNQREITQIKMIDFHLCLSEA